MVLNAFRMTKTSAKLLLRSKAFWIVGVGIPLIATLLLNIWGKLQTPVKTDKVYEAGSMDEQLAYHVDFNRFPVKVYDRENDTASNEMCTKLNQSGMFQIFHVDASSHTKEEIMESARASALEDKIGAILILEKNYAESELFSVGEDERFKLLEDTLPLVLANPNCNSDEAVITYFELDSQEVIKYKDVRNFGYCMAIASIAFVFGGILVLNTYLTEKQDHVYARILLTNATKASYMLSKLILTCGVAFVQALLMLICRLLFVSTDVGVSHLQFFVILFSIGLIFNFASLCVGLFFNSIAASAFIAFCIWSISALLSGSYFDIESAGEGFKKIALIMPQRWGIFAVSRFQHSDLSGYSLIACVTLAYLVIILVIGVIGLKFNSEE